MNKKELYYYTQLVALAQLSTEFDLRAYQDIFGNECPSLQVFRSYKEPGKKYSRTELGTFIEFRDEFYNKEICFNTFSTIIDSVRKHYTGISSVNYSRYGFQPEVEMATAQILESIKQRGKEDYKTGDQYLAGMENNIRSLFNISQYLEEKSREYSTPGKEKKYKVIKTRVALLNCTTALLNRFFLSNNMDDTFLNKFTQEYEQYLSEAIYAGLLATDDCPIEFTEGNLSCEASVIQEIIDDLKLAKKRYCSSSPDGTPIPYEYGQKFARNTQPTTPPEPKIIFRPKNIIGDPSDSMER